MRVGPDERVGEREVSFPDTDDAREVLEVDLVADTGTGRDDTKVRERLLGPPQQVLALFVAGGLGVHIALEGVRRPEGVDRHGVVDDEVDGQLGLQKTAPSSGPPRLAWRRDSRRRAPP